MALQNYDYHSTLWKTDTADNHHYYYTTTTATSTTTTAAETPATTTSWHFITHFHARADIRTNLIDKNSGNHLILSLNAGLQLSNFHRKAQVSYRFTQTSHYLPVSFSFCLRPFLTLSSDLLLSHQHLYRQKSGAKKPSLRPMTVGLCWLFSRSNLSSLKIWGDGVPLV